jgi:hypothetical protein
MIEPLDYLEKDETTLADPAKILNTVLIFLPFLIILYTVWSVWNTKVNFTSPWLPEYTAYYINGTLINLAFIQSGGIIPGLFLRVRSHYILSSGCIIAFILVANLLKNEVQFYSLFF